MRIEPTRIREHGTHVTLAATPADRVAAVRRIVDAKQYAVVDGLMVDLFSASAIIAVHDALNDVNRAKFSELPIRKMASVAFKLIN